MNSEYCDWTWDSENCGYRVSGKGAYAANSIFLPACGYWSYENYRFEHTGGIYMTATQGGNSNFCYVLNFSPTATAMYSTQPASHILENNDGNALRYVGHSVRAVAVQKVVRQ